MVIQMSLLIALKKSKIFMNAYKVKELEYYVKNMERGVLNKYYCYNIGIPIVKNIGFTLPGKN